MAQITQEANNIYVYWAQGNKISEDIISMKLLWPPMFLANQHEQIHFKLRNMYVVMEDHKRF